MVRLQAAPATTTEVKLRRPAKLRADIEAIVALPPLTELLHVVRTEELDLRLATKWGAGSRRRETGFSIRARHDHWNRLVHAVNGWHRPAGRRFPVVLRPDACQQRGASSVSGTLRPGL